MAQLAPAVDAPLPGLTPSPAAEPLAGAPPAAIGTSPALVSNPLDTNVPVPPTLGITSVGGEVTSAVPAALPVSSLNPGIPTTQPLVSPSTALSATETSLSDSLSQSLTSSSLTKTSSSSLSSSSTSTLSSASATSTHDSGSHSPGWTTSIIGPVVGIAGALLILSIAARFYSLWSRRNRRKRKRNLIGPEEFDDDHDDKYGAGSLLNSTVQPHDFQRSDGTDFSANVEGRRAGPSPSGQSPFKGGRGGSGGNSSVEKGYNEDELLGNIPGARTPAPHTKAWAWMKSTFTNEAAFGDKYTRGPPIKRSVLSFVNLSPFAGGRVGRDEEARDGPAPLWGSTAAGWRDVSAVVVANSPPPPTPPSKSPYQVPRRPVGTFVYSPLVNSSDGLEPRSIDAVLAENRPPSDQQQVSSSKDHDAAPSRLPSWRDALRRLSGQHSPRAADGQDQEHIKEGSGSDIDENEEANTSATGFRVPSFGNAYRRVSRGNDQGDTQPLRRAQTRVHRPAPAATGKTLNKHASMMALGQRVQASNLKRQATVRIVEQPRRGDGDSGARISRSPSKYPPSDTTSIYTVDSETRAVLQHLSASTPIVGTPDGDSIIHFDQVDATPNLANMQQLQRQGTVTSSSSAGPGSSQHRRLQRAETVVQNAVQRVAAQKHAQAANLRRAATTASSDRQGHSDSNGGEDHTASSSGATSRSPSTTSRASRLRPSQSMYNTARRTLMTETPEVPQLKSVLSDSDGPTFASGNASEKEADTVDSKSEYSSDDGPPSLVHGSASSSDAEDEIPESLVQFDHMQPSPKQGKGIPATGTSDKGAEQFGSGGYADNVAVYRAALDDAYTSSLASVARPGEMRSPPKGDAAAQPASPTRTPKGRSELKPKKSILKNGTPKQDASPVRSAASVQNNDFVSSEVMQSPPGVELFDPPVGGWRGQPGDAGRDQDDVDPQTPTKKRSWKQRDGRWIASEDHDFTSPTSSPLRRTPQSSVRTTSPPPLPSPAAKAVTTPRRGAATSSIGDRSLEARLMSSMSPSDSSAMSPFGKHAELFFSPPLGASADSTVTAHQGRRKSPQRASPTRVATTRTRDILAADTVRPRLPGHRGSASESDSILSPAASSYVAATPTAADALMSLAFSPTASDAGAAQRRLPQQNDTDSEYEYQSSSSRTTSPQRRHALNRARPSPRSQRTMDAHSAISTDLHYRGDQSSISTSAHSIERSRKMTKSSMTLASQYSAVAESTYSSNQEALTEAEERGRVGLDDALSAAWKTRAGSAST
ncbi:unnamed protein product [Parajaminaea phylloscopi]